jgi:peptidoglycan/xylan/chitin deacetylase (PgdA/CDA1 family)
VVRTTAIAAGRIVRASAEGGGGAILLYHRIARLRRDPFGIAVRPARFREHLTVLARRATVLPLAGLHAALDAGAAPPGAVAITFDDGYADNLPALATLSARGLSATLFVTTGLVATSREQWWDELERLLLRPGRLPDVLEIDVDGERRRWELGSDAKPGLLAAHRTRGWRAWHPPPTRRHLAYRELWTLLHPMDPASRDAALRQLAGILEAMPEGRSSHRMLDREELMRLSGLPCIELGAHTVNHPSLAALGVEAQRREIAESKVALENLIGRDVESFAYPYGARGDFDIETKQTVRDAGFARACSNYGGAVPPRPDPFDLPRVVIQDWPAAEFADRLEKL